MKQLNKYSLTVKLSVKDPQYLASVALLISLGVQKRTLGLVRDWTPAVVGAALPGLVAVLIGLDMNGNLRTSDLLESQCSVSSVSY